MNPIAEQIGIDNTVLTALKSAVSNGWLQNLHGVVILRHGKTVFEEYFSGEDEILGRPIGQQQFNAGVLHDARSITKSIVGLLYGIALADGDVPAVDCPLFEALDEYSDLLVGPIRRGMLVRHALTMSLGLEWDESRLYCDPRNDERRMCMAADKCRFVFSRPQINKPGERWTYTGGATEAIAKLIEKGTKKSFIDFARSRLLSPLGIELFEWTCDESGEPSAAGGLRMTPRDMAKIGQLVLNKGRWNGKSLVPQQWIEEATGPRISIDTEKSYGYFWTLSTTNIGCRITPLVAAIGFGGQRIYVLPELDTVTVIAAGNYRLPDNWRVPVAVLNQFVLPAIAAAPNSLFNTGASRKSM